MDLYTKIKDKNYCERQLYLKNHYLNIILYYFDVLKKGGNSCITFFSYCDPSTINIIYLLSLMFKEIIIYNAVNIYCKSFLLDESSINKNDIMKCIENTNFNITNKYHINNFINYINNIYKNKIYVDKLIFNKKYNDKYINYKINIYLEYFIVNNLLNSDKYNIFITSLIINYNYAIITPNLRKMGQFFLKKI
jgi:hypothetical protein